MKREIGGAGMAGGFSETPVYISCQLFCSTTVDGGAVNFQPLTASVQMVQHPSGIPNIHACVSQIANQTFDCMLFKVVRNQERVTPFVLLIRVHSTISSFSSRQTIIHLYNILGHSHINLKPPHLILVRSSKECRTTNYPRGILQLLYL